MNNLKIKIKQREFDIQEDIALLIQHKTMLINKINSIKSNFILSELLAAGFTLGYLLAPRKDGKDKRRRFVVIIIFLKLKKWFKKFSLFINKTTSSLSKLQSISSASP